MKHERPDTSRLPPVSGHDTLEDLEGYSCWSLERFIPGIALAKRVTEKQDDIRS